MKIRRARTWIPVVAIAALALSNAASATLVTLSQQSSDETDAAVLDATVDFDVSGDTLTITVTNTTLDDGTGYDINQVYFNSADGISLAEDTFPADWSLAANQGVGVFGNFDWGLIDGVGNSSAIAPQDFAVFTFTITGTAGKLDFLQLSTNPPGSKMMMVAAKFVRGPKDDSAFGASVPTPGALSLLALAGVICGGRRRRA